MMLWEKIAAVSAMLEAGFDEKKQPDEVKMPPSRPLERESTEEMLELQAVEDLSLFEVEKI